MTLESRCTRALTFELFCQYQNGGGVGEGRGPPGGCAARPDLVLKAEGEGATGENTSIVASANMEEG